VQIEVRECLLSFGAESFAFWLLSKYLKINIYRNIILPVVLYGCETWSLLLREQLRLRLIVNRVLMRMCGSKRNGIRGEGRKLHNEELNDLYSSSTIVRVIKYRKKRWAGYIARMGMGESYTVFW
jgi:hypothetical protein